MKPAKTLTNFEDIPAAQALLNQFCKPDADESVGSRLLRSTDYNSPIIRQNWLH
jgi:hypothetical protein